MIKRLFILVFMLLVGISGAHASNVDVDNNISKEYDLADSEDEIIDNPYVRGWSTTKQYNVVNRIGRKLRAVSEIDNERVISFSVERKYSANAYTDQHDNIVIFRGILNYLENEDELAFIIGHELGHVEHKHVKTNAIRRGGLAVAGTALNLVLPGTGVITTVGGKFANDKFSRKDEFLADKRGIDYLVKAGYNPLAAISILHKTGSNYNDFWYNHPSTQKRIWVDYNYIKNQYPQYLEKGFNTEAYKNALDDIATIDINKQGEVRIKNKHSKSKKMKSDEKNDKIKSENSADNTADEL